MHSLNSTPKTNHRRLKKNKVRTAKVIIRAVGTGICIGFIPYSIIKGAECHWFYIVPFIPVIIYLIVRIIRDLKGWYENEEM